MEFNDGNQYHYIVDKNAYLGAGRTMYEMRVCSANLGKMYIDTQYHSQRRLIQPDVDCFLQYQFPMIAAGSAKHQAEFFLSAIGEMRDNEIPMCDIEPHRDDRGNVRGIPANQSLDFFMEWCCETVFPETGTHAICYVPKEYSPYLNFETLGHEHMIKAPRYPLNNVADKWGPTPDWDHHIHQVGQNNSFPGGNGRGDLNTTRWSAKDIVNHFKGDNESSVWDAILTEFVGPS